MNYKLYYTHDKEISYIDDRLRNLYSIDTYNLSKEIRNVLLNSSTSSFNEPKDYINLILNIVPYIFSKSYTHINYQPFSISKSIFGYIYDAFNYKNSIIMNNLTSVSITNDLILYSLYNILNDSNKDTIALTNDNLASLRVGYFNNSARDIVQKNKCDFIKNGNNISSNFTKLKNKKFSQLSLSILEQLGNESDNPNFTAFNYTKNSSLLIFSHKAFNSYGTQLSNHKDLLFRNLNLSTIVSNSMHNQKIDIVYPSEYPLYLEANIDKLLYSAPLEYYYGFNLTKTLLEFTTQRKFTSYKYKERLSKININLLSHDLVDLYHNPLIHSRSFLFNFGLEMAARTTLLNANYNKGYTYINHKICFEPLYLPYEDCTKVTNERVYDLCSTQLHDYLILLNHISIPLLKDLWDYILYKLVRLLDIDNEKLISILRLYIDDYYELYTQDFSTLFNFSNIKELFIEPIQELHMTKTNDNTLICPKLTKEYMDKLKVIILNNNSATDSIEIKNESNLKKLLLKNDYMLLNEILISSLNKHIFKGYRNNSITQDFVYKFYHSQTNHPTKTLLDFYKENLYDIN